MTDAPTRLTRPRARPYLTLTLLDVDDFLFVAPTNFSESSVNEVLTSWLCNTDDYYDERLHMCAPKDGAQKEPESLGSILFGDRVFSTPFDVHTLRLSLLHLAIHSLTPMR